MQQYFATEKNYSNTYSYQYNERGDPIQISNYFYIVLLVMLRKFTTARLSMRKCPETLKITQSFAIK